MHTVIATVTTAEPVVVSESFESAAQYRDLVIPPGTYELQVRTGNHGARYCALVVSGEVRSSGYGPRANREEIGTTREYIVQKYAYQLREAIATGQLCVGRADTKATAWPRGTVVATLPADEIEAALASVRGV